ncbi:SipW-dependent-type signal peptide-containing protein [Ruania halotolerans]|uniref:SipW-dependent-type signal peptide-containing protein n=1 Tax=Ruania halotolerans TaxID=2897773 RepID=UPI001E4A6FB6|nr:SipW-dependent-type signal peptide-containing protein [Ruania halotolerans]UFU06513.1 SipW-dependent-type signal peptide-containing protein [Ruania halotolerans]
MSTIQSRPQRSRKIRAILAGGVVLGVGAAVTLAAWNDSEFTSGLFGAGSFNLQGSTTSATTGFTDHESADGAAALTFTAPFDNLAPEDVVYAPFWVRLAADTTSPANLALVAVDSTDDLAGNSANLSYAVYAIAPGAACDETATSGVELGSAATLADDTAVTGGSVALPVGDPTTDPGVATQLCTIVTAGADLEQGGQTTAVWQFTATSE